MSQEGWDGYEEEAERIAKAKPRLKLIEKLWFLFGLWTLAKYYYGLIRRRLLRGSGVETEYITVFTHGGKSVHMAKPKPGRYPFYRHTHTFVLESTKHTASWADEDGALIVERRC